MKESIKLRTVFWVLCLMAWVTTVSFVFSARGHAKCTGVSVNIDLSTGQQFVTESEIKALVIDLTDSLSGENIEEINISMLEESLEAHDYVKRAEVYSTIDSKLRVDVYQHQPIARIMSQGDQFYLDDEGRVFPLHPSFTSRVPIITGIVNDSMLVEVLDILTVLNQDPLLRSQIVEIESKEDQTYLLYPRLGTHYIVWGHSQENSEKAKKLINFYKEIIRKTGPDYYKSIDLSFNNQVVAAKR